MSRVSELTEPHKNTHAGTHTCPQYVSWSLAEVIKLASGIPKSLERQPKDSTKLWNGSDFLQAKLLWQASISMKTGSSIQHPRQPSSDSLLRWLVISCHPFHWIIKLSTAPLIKKNSFL